MLAIYRYMCMYSTHFLIIHASKSRCLPWSIRNLDEREFTMAAMLLYFSSLKLVNIHSHTCMKRKITSTMSTKTTATPHTHTHSRSHAWAAKSKMWQEATVRKGAESLLFLFLCLLYAAFGKVNAYASLCINVAFRWVNIKNWAWKKAKWRRKTLIAV